MMMGGVIKVKEITNKYQWGSQFYDSILKWPIPLDPEPLVEEGDLPFYKKIFIFGISNRQHATFV